ncbi:MAG: DUF4886 domain-containing protein [Rikenellaceae bacterium]|nr:DUF4886 domain-containing protein [Rikenellaceae bacterium]
MTKKIFVLLTLSALLMAGCSDYDDTALRGRVDGYLERVEALKQKVDQLNDQLGTLGALTSGNVVTSVTVDGEGRHIITYLDSDDIEHTVVVATADRLTDLPLLGVDESDGIYYWTLNTGGDTDWLTDSNDDKVPVSGHTPVLSVDSDGYWTVDGERVTGPDGQPVTANTDESAIISSAELDSAGNLVLTLPDGTVITLQVFEGLNLTFANDATVYVGTTDTGYTVRYALTGVSAGHAVVDIAATSNLSAVVDRTEGTIAVTFDSGFRQGYLLVLAYDLADNTILRPVFFERIEEGFTISTAQQLMDFAAEVNAGGAAAYARVELASDIDMSSVTAWTPIGNATFSFASNAVTITGNAFRGEFDGMGFSILNFRPVCDYASAGSAFGLFGVLDGATVRNLTVGAPSGDNSRLTVSASASVDCGVIAGMLHESTLENCTNYADMEYDGTAGARVTMAMAGFAFADAEATQFRSCTNYGRITAGSTGNTTNGATGVHAAGICGFSSNEASSTASVRFHGCENYGYMESAAPRTSGIVAAANRFTVISHCVNYGDQLNSYAVSGGARPGNITCLIGTGGSMDNTINKGNLASTTSGRCGGLVSLVNAAVSFENCANYGEILTDDPNRGVFFGYNSQSCSWNNCIAGGLVGTYNGGSPVYDFYNDVDKESYLGAQPASNATLSNITYVIGTMDGGLNPEKAASLRVLFIGNSFTKDAVEHLPGILTAAGVDGVKMTHMYYGGRTIPEYTDGYSTVTDYYCYRSEPGTSSWSLQRGLTIRDVVLEDEWDIVSLQEHTGKSNAWSWTAAEKSAIQDLIDLIKADQQSDPKFVYIMSQAYADPSILSYGQSSVLTNNFASQAEMFQTITAQAQKVLAETSVEQVIPTGTVLQNLRTSSLQNHMDLTRDGYHMDYGISRYAASCAVFESILSAPLGNLTMDGNPYRYDTSDNSTTDYSTPVTDLNAPVALRAARAAIASPYTVTDLGI